MKTHNERMEEIQAKALRCIATHGTLRWCGAQICGCMGCANHFMTEDEYHVALRIPAVKDALSKKSEHESISSIWNNAPDMRKNTTVIKVVKGCNGGSYQLVDTDKTNELVF